MSLVGLLNYVSQQQGASDYKKLEESYRQPADPSQLPIGNTPEELDQNILKAQGGYRGAGGVLSGGPPSEFYLRAAALPGYQQLAQQAQVGQQAMERQMQGQQWDSNNMTLAQKTAADMNQQNTKWEQERRQFEWNNPSAVQNAQIQNARANTGIAAGNLAINQAHLGLQQQKFQFDQTQAQRAAQFPALALTGQQQMDYRTNVSKMDRAAAIATDTLDYLSTVGTGAKALDRGTVNAMRAAYEQHVVPALATMVGTGTIQQGDMEFIKSVIGEPGGWATLDANQKAKVGQILQSVQEERSRMYGLSGVQAPPIKPGSSAWARSRGTVNTPDDIQWGP